MIVNLVTPGSPADQAGLQRDDIILSIEGSPVRNFDDLVCYIGEFTSPGDIISITISRNGIAIDLDARLSIR